VTMDIPIVSVDYSLAPEAPFPRAIEEIFYAYCWILNNPQLVGWTGENIIFVGDSAGGNLLTACMIKCIEMGIRKPNGFLCNYVSFFADYAMVPSRFLGLMEVCLPYHIHMKLYRAYNGQITKKVEKSSTRDFIPRSEISSSDVKISKNYLMSPQRAPDSVLRNFPPIKIVSTDLDSCLDECVEFAKKLKRLDVNVQLDVLKGLNHAFLGMTLVSFIDSATFSCLTAALTFRFQKNVIKVHNFVCNK
jgi:hormone-sensitive lipase